ncbi:MSCRAMM family protein [Candidatus Electronema sp. JM]|uniref:MSCRAMM family protein n=1 Tax=Candidatus Electronema sp. JM TaxID=3401571 RepID=UPI003AA8EC92
MRPQAEHILLRKAAMLLFAFLFFFRPTIATAQTAAGTITGTVKAADTQALLQNLAVGVYRADNATTLVKAVRTNTVGVFTLTGLTTGNYKVRFFPIGINYIGGWYKSNTSSPASVVEEFGNGDVITLTSSAGANLGETQLNVGLTITGKVTQAPAPATGIPGVYVQAYLEDGITWVRTSDAATTTGGDYTISGLRAGNYKVRFWAYQTEYTTVWYSNAVSAAPTNTVYSADQATSVAAGGTGTTNGQLATGGSISGTVYKAGNVPVVGALISVYDSSYTFRGFTTSGNGGIYQVQGLPVPGTYFVQFYEKFINNIGTGLTEWYQDASNISDSKIKSVDITTGSSGIDAVLDRGPISGKVSDSTGLPLSGVSVTIYDSSKQTVTSVVTDAQGQYSTGELQAGDYKVQFSPLSWYANKTNFTEATSVPAGSSGVNGIFKPFNFAHIYNVLLLKKRCSDANGTSMPCNCFEADGTPAYCPGQ